MKVLLILTCLLFSAGSFAATEAGKATVEVTAAGHAVEGHGGELCDEADKIVGSGTTVVREGTVREN